MEAFIVSHLIAWHALIKKYNLTPTTITFEWPILVVFDDPVTDINGNAVISKPLVVPIDMALTFLAMCPLDRLGKTDITRRNELLANLSICPSNSSVTFQTNDTASTVSLLAADPMTGVQGEVEVKEDPDPIAIPGLQEIPIDPGKAEPKQKIADLGDPTEHVLDEERAV